MLVFFMILIFHKCSFIYNFEFYSQIPPPTLPSKTNDVVAPVINSTIVMEGELPLYWQSDRLTDFSKDNDVDGGGDYVALTHKHSEDDQRGCGFGEFCAGGMFKKVSFSF